MICPECGAPCWAESVHNGVCMIYDVFECTKCDWTEDMDWPMSDKDWDKFLNEGKESLNEA